MFEMILDVLLRLAPLLGTVGGLVTAVVALSSDGRHRRRLIHLATVRKDAPPESLAYLDALHRRAVAAYVARAVARARFGLPLIPLVGVALMAVALSSFIGVRAIIPSVDAVPTPFPVQVVMWCLGPSLTGMLIATFAPDRLRREAWRERVQVLIERGVGVNDIDSARPKGEDLGLPKRAGSGSGFVFGLLIGIAIEATAAGLALTTLPDPSRTAQSTVLIAMSLAITLCIFPISNLARWRAWGDVQKSNDAWLETIPARQDSAQAL